MDYTDVFETCCRGRSCCPEVQCQGDYVWIKDDDGEVVHMTIAELLDVCTTVVEKLQAEKFE